MRVDADYQLKSIICLYFGEIEESSFFGVDIVGGIVKGICWVYEDYFVDVQGEESEALLRMFGGGRLGLRGFDEFGGVSWGNIRLWGLC